MELVPLLLLEERVVEEEDEEPLRDVDDVVADVDVTAEDDALDGPTDDEL